MSILYRAIWNDDRPGLASAALYAMRAWVATKSDGAIELPNDGTVHGTAVGLARDDKGALVPVAYPANAKVERAADADGNDVLRASFVEQRDDGSRWATTVRAWRLPGGDPDSPDGAGWLWVDVEAVADGGLDRVTVVAPRLVADLLRSGDAPRRRCVPLSDQHTAYDGEQGAEDLAALLTHTDRDVPVVIFAGDVPDNRRRDQQAAVRTAASQNAGLVAVVTIDAGASKALQDILGREFGVWGGAFRTYLPGLDPARARDDWRHRYVTADGYVRNQRTAASLISRAVAPSAAARRAPRTYEAARAILDTRHVRDVAEWRQLAEAAEVQAAQQRDHLALAEDRYIDLLADHESTLAESTVLKTRLAAAARDLDRAHRALSAAGADEFWQTASDEDQIPAEAANCSDAAAQAQLYLSDWLALPNEACVDLQDLDTSVESRAWGQTAWQGFLALAAFAEEQAESGRAGSFWNWCQSGHPLAWRATSKKLSMVESESVRHDKDNWARRMLPVDPEVDTSGRTRMEAHLKIAEGGGNLAPRIYFVQSLRTGKVHVGYFGPHRNMPNTRT